MAAASPPQGRDDFEIAVICALELEAQCVCDALDKIWTNEIYDNAPSDDNVYTLGVIGKHNVVIVHMPGMGTIRAAAAAANNLTFSFENIKLALVVGICGGMPHKSDGEEILLGDVVISNALVQYNFGRQYPRGFERKTDAQHSFGVPSEKIRAFLAKLGVRQHLRDVQIATTMFLHTIQEKSPATRYPGSDNDILYPSSYHHQHRLPAACDTCRNGLEICNSATQLDCEDLGCESKTCIPRQRLVNASTTEPMIHIGVMGSADTVMKSASHRDALAQHENIIAVEMEGAGVRRSCPCIVVKGVCDYAGSHKRKGWQYYAAATAAACMKAILMQWLPEKKQVKPVQIVRLNEYFLVPRYRVKNFFGREEELADITTYFDENIDHDRPRTLVLQAMGGQGKSQIALEYCQRARQSYRGIFWGNGSSAPTTTQAFISIAHTLDKSTATALSNDDEKVTFALRALEQWKERWLLVFDNCDDVAFFSQIDQFIPQVGRGSILLTSRHRDLGELGDILEVSPMHLEANVALLLHRYRGVNRNDYISEAAAIVNRLGGLALAIDQASAYMQYTQLSIDKLGSFLPQYLSQRDKILQHTTNSFWRYIKLDDTNERQIAINAFTTWEMSFEQFINSWDDGDSVAHFLTLSGFLAPILIEENLFFYHWSQGSNPHIWSTLFTAPSLGETSSQAVEYALDLGTDQVIECKKTCSSDTIWDADKFWHLIQQAYQMCLIQSITPRTEAEGASFQLHPLIRDWLQLRQNSIERQRYTREVVDVIVSSTQLPGRENGDFRVIPTSIQHLDAILASENEFFTSEKRLGHEIATCLNARFIAVLYQFFGRYDVSFSLFRTIAEVQERVLGEKDPDTLKAKHDLALALGLENKYEEAEQLYRAVIEMREEVLGKEHLHTLESKNGLANTLRDLGQYIESEKISRQVIDVEERVLGRVTLTTSISKNNIAVALAYQGKHVEAEQIYRELIEEAEEGLGTYQTWITAIKHNLAMTLDEQGKSSEAEEMLHTVIQTREKLLGRAHPEVLRSKSNLAQTLRNTGRSAEAEQIWRVVEQEQSRLLGKQHRDTLVSGNNLAMALGDLDRFLEAEVILLRVLKSWVATLGTQHPHTKMCGDNLRTIWRRSGREEAEIDRELEEILGP